MADDLAAIESVARIASLIRPELRRVSLLGPEYDDLIFGPICDVCGAFVVNAGDKCPKHKEPNHG